MGIRSHTGSSDRDHFPKTPYCTMALSWLLPIPATIYEFMFLHSFIFSLDSKITGLKNHWSLPRTPFLCLLLEETLYFREIEFLILNCLSLFYRANYFILGSPLLPLILDMPISFIHQAFNEHLYQTLWLKIREQLNLEG